MQKGLAKNTSESARVSNKESLKYGITRGASYYKGGDRS